MAVPAHVDPPGPVFPTRDAMRSALSAVEGLAARFPTKGAYAATFACLRHTLAAGVRELSSEGLRARLADALDLPPGVSDDAIVAAVRDMSHSSQSASPLTIDGDNLDSPHSSNPPLTIDAAKGDTSQSPTSAPDATPDRDDLALRQIRHGQR